MSQLLTKIKFVLFITIESSGSVTLHIHIF